MASVEAPARRSTPGHSISGAAGAPVAVRVTPSFGADEEEKKLEIRLVTPGESDESGPEEPVMDEQPASNRPPSSSAAALQALLNPSSVPGRIGITRFFRRLPRTPAVYINQTVATPRPIMAVWLVRDGSTRGAQPVKGVARPSFAPK